ncbi:hypothetical protein ZWY2020_011122 [Hordeum vulgare]|nr:hypothetical protein ZWY2020_011122 [Hordeum vulgare]
MNHHSPRSLLFDLHTTADASGGVWRRGRSRELGVGRHNANDLTLGVHFTVMASASTNYLEELSSRDEWGGQL